MIEKLGPQRYIYIIFAILIIVEFFVQKYKNIIYKEKIKGKHLENDILFIKKKLEKLHPERVNLYLNEYYKEVGYNPVNNIIVYIILNSISLFLFFKLISPKDFVLKANPNFLFVSNIYDKVNLSFSNMNSFLFILLIGVISLISENIRRAYKKKMINPKKEVKVFEDISFKNSLISIFITFLLYYLLNLRKVLAVVILVKNIIGMIYNLIQLYNSSNNAEDELKELFDNKSNVNVWKIVNRAMKENKLK